MVGQIDPATLKSVESLVEAGREDERRIVRNGDRVEMHQWIGSQGKWTKIGDVVDTEKAAPKMIDGKPYDYVFDVDVKEGSPPLKIGFNKGDDAWMVAQQFLYKHDLPQEYLSQIAEFLVRNVGADAVPARSLAGDPLTGGSRYIPRAAPAEPSNPASSLSSAFVGGGAYRSGSAAKKAASSFFPQTAHVIFHSGNAEGMGKKLRQHNAALEQQGVDAAQLEALLVVGKEVCAGNLKVEVTDAHVQTLRAMLDWPEDNLLPVLDLARLVMCTGAGASGLMSDGNEDVFFKMVSQCNPARPATVRMMAVRFLSNSLYHPVCRPVVLKHAHTLLETVEGMSGQNTNTRTALAGLLLNVCVEVSKIQNVPLDVIVALTAQLTAALQGEEEAPLQLQLCCALGTLVVSNTVVREAVAAESSLQTRIGSLCHSSEQRVQMCALDVKRVLGSE